MKTKFFLFMLIFTILAGLFHVQPVRAATNAWSALPKNGLNGEVKSIAQLGDMLYVGGTFTQTADGTVTGLNNIARYNLTTKTWSALAHNGLDDTVNAIVFIGTDMYVGGSFNATKQGTALNFLTKYDTVNNTWSPFSEEGVNAAVGALAVSGQTLYIGGGFTSTNQNNTPNIRNIGRYRTDTNTWYAMPGQGLNGEASALLIKGGYLYVGGNFTQTHDGTTTGLNRIARYHLLGNSWSALAVNGLNNTVWAITSVGNDVYVGGRFTQNQSGTIPLSYIAKYDPAGNTFSALPNNPLNDWVLALAPYGDELYVGGDFFSISNRSIIKYSPATNTWNSAPSEGLFSRVNSILITNGELFAGGSFTQSGDGSITLNQIAQFSIRNSGTYKSGNLYDGWVLETTETSSSGGTVNSASTTLIVGDDAANKQYRSILHFDTSSLPDTAVITSVLLKIKEQSVTSTNPFSILGSLKVDIRNPRFGLTALEPADFSADAKKTGVATINSIAVDGWHSASFNNAGRIQISLTSTTQLRIAFTTDDNNNNIAEFIKFYSGNAPAANRPKLIIQYYVP